MSKKREEEKFTIITDTREQSPFTFANITPVPEIVTKTLRTGDYSVVGYENKVCVERKSLSDLFGTCGQGRERFERELRRMATFAYAAVVVEADWVTVLRSPPFHSKLNPKTIYASVIAWTQRYNRCHWWLCPNRTFAEKTTYRLLERYYKDVQAGVYCYDDTEKF